MTILNWIRRRAKSRHADDKAVTDFANVAKGQGLPLDYDRDARLVELLNRPAKEAGDNLEEIAKLLGQHGP